MFSIADDEGHVSRGNGESGQQHGARRTLLASVKENPNAYDTMLVDLEDGGIDLSGGQWQRLAITRMLYRKAGIYIWDEPAAAMDPLAESGLYADFLHKRSEQCANIFVTHRLGVAVNADENCVWEMAGL